MVNKTKPKKGRSFKNYYFDIFLPRVKKLQQKYTSERIDIVFDTYRYTIMKASKRIERGKVICQKVQDDSIATAN